MKIILERTYNCKNYCIGHLYYITEDEDQIKKYICDVIEDTDRGLKDTMKLEEIEKMKVYAKTAIPTGKYQVTLNVVSPKFNLKPYYRKFCNGKVPRLLGVKGYEGILIHIGINQNSSAGCLIVGYNKIKGQVVQSQQAFEKLYKILLTAKHGIQIEILRKNEYIK